MPWSFSWLRTNSSCDAISPAVCGMPGNVVVETDSGEEAMAMCKSDMSIDMVFTDINLVGTASGLDVAECYRMERPDVPVLYTSGKVIDERRRVPRSLFIPKPYRSIEVLDAFQRLRTPAS